MARRIFPLKTSVGEMPEEFNDNVTEIVTRILTDPAVLGIVYFKNNFVHMCTVPATMRRALTTKLPSFNPLVYTAITEIDVLDELVAYRIETMTCEILVAGDKNMGAVVVQTRASKKSRRKKVKA